MSKGNVPPPSRRAKKTAIRLLVKSPSSATNPRNAERRPSGRRLTILANSTAYGKVDKNDRAGGQLFSQFGQALAVKTTSP
jgi:hypothetical protein